MKLSKADREFIRRNFWENEQAIDQIEAAIGKTTFEVYSDETNAFVKVSAKTAIEILGREMFLAGMDRSAFHRNAAVTGDNLKTVYFDSTKFFKGGLV